MLDYFELSEKYRPDEVNTLLIAEAPPPLGDKYFYLPRRMSANISIENDQTLPATIFNHYFGKRPDSEDEYKSFLNQLMNHGIFLMDILDEPLRIRDRKESGQINQRNLEILISEIPNLRSKIKNRKIEISDESIVFVLPRMKYKRHIKNEFPQSEIYQWKKFKLTIELL